MRFPGLSRSKHRVVATSFLCQLPFGGLGMRMIFVREMKRVMVPPAHQHKVIGMIVCSVVVLMMHYLTLLEQPSDALFHHQLVLIDTTAGIGSGMPWAYNPYISPWITMPSALPLGVRRAGFHYGEISSIAVPATELISESVSRNEFDSALEAYFFDHFDLKGDYTRDCQCRQASGGAKTGRIYGGRSR